MADSNKLALGLDDIIRLDRTANRRGGGRGGGNRGRTGRGGGNRFQNRGGGGIVSCFFFIFYFDFSNQFYLASNIKCTSRRSLET
jgi:hypothetical protein